MTPPAQFHNLYTHGFARLAVCTPRCKVADPVHNGAQTLAAFEAAARDGAAIALFPELGLSAYTCDDLFHQRPLQGACLRALADFLAATRAQPTVAVLGLPLRVSGRLFNCAVVALRGEILGVVPKTYLPNYGEFYEARQFSSADEASVREIDLLGRRVPFGADLVFSADDVENLALFVEICEDVWTPIPPSSFAALAGATVLLNLSASNVTVGKAGYRRQLVSQQSARCLAAYAYSSAGDGESTTDLAWDGHALVCENGELLAESQRFLAESQTVTADVDLERLAQERMRQTSFGQSVRRHAQAVAALRTVRFALGRGQHGRLPLRRRVEPRPYVPSRPEQRDERCEEVYGIQVQALVQRMVSARIEKLVIGVSGGLDSTQALLVCARAMDRLGLPRANILAFTMPGYATGERTLAQANELMQAIGCTARTIDIRPSCDQMLRDLGHPYADGQPVYDVTFENVQAGERTSHLFRLANHHGGIVVGTGDLSELALGWCTYGVGDHMSHYNVNASVPKTLVRYLVRWVAETAQVGEAARDVLVRILETEVSPELVPAGAGGAALQSTEATVGAYDLQDFNLYYTIRHGYSPRKIAFLAEAAWAGAEESRLAGGAVYALPQIKAALRIFVRRFFAGSQFKRSCVPNAPKVGNGGSLSPRGDWRAPSDSESAVWVAEVEGIPD